MSDTLMTIPLSQLQRSKANIRKTNRKSDIEGLAASIAAHGLLQNLTVKPMAATNANERFEVVAGGRRLAALKLLAKRKRLPTDTPVPCRLIAEDDAPAEISLAENFERTPLHPADQFAAFAKLQAQGLGADEIAARFGVARTFVVQRLKLYAVSPKLMDVYRAGEMTLEQLEAFTLTDDHAAQERVWFDGHSFSHSPHTIRQALTKTLVAGSDRRARFVGIKAYEAAGGTIIRDLFSLEDDGYFADSELLDRMTAEKLTAEAENIRAEGWAFVDVLPRMDYEYLAQFQRVPSMERVRTPEEETVYKDLCGRHDALVAELDEVEIVDALDRLDDEIAALEREEWSPEAKAAAGAFLCLDYAGELSVMRGLAKRDPHKGEVAAKPNEKADRRHTADTPDAANALPEALLEDLSTHRTAALREVLARDSEIAFTALLHTLVLQTFHESGHDLCVDIRPAVVDLRSSSETVSSSTAVAALVKRHQRWAGELPESDALWTWLAKQSGERRKELLAFCTASAVNAVYRRREGIAPDRRAQSDLIAEATSLDMADWWEPTPELYLGRVSKRHILTAVKEAVSAQAAENIERLKKDAMVVRAQELLTGRHWLPMPLRRSTSPAHAAQ